MPSNTGTQKSQLDLQNQLQQQQQARQNAILDQNKTALTPYLSGNQGFTPEQLAALRSAALDQNALRFNQAQQLTNATLAARGESGMTPGSGVQATGYGNLQAARAGDLSDSLRTITLNNAQQGLANKFNAASVLSGNAQTYGQNVGTYGSGASNALSNYTQAQGNGFLSQFAKGLGSGIGGGVSAGLTGGLGAGLSSLSNGKGFVWGGKQ